MSSIINDPVGLTVIVGFAGGIVASFFKDKLVRAKKESEDTLAWHKQIEEVNGSWKKAFTELELRVNKEMTSTSVKVDLFWKIIEEKVPALLMKPTHKHMDGLLLKMSQKQLTKDEAVELKGILESEYEIDAKAKRLDRAWLLVLTLARLEQVIAGFD